VNELEIWEGSSFFFYQERIDFDVLGAKRLMPNILTH